jgi:hypothetical protein
MSSFCSTDSFCFIFFCFGAGGMSSTVFKPFFTAFLLKVRRKFRERLHFLYYFCETLSIEKESIEQNFFSHLLCQNVCYVQSVDAAYAQEVLASSRQVVGVVWKKFLQCIHFPEAIPSRETIVANAIKASCVESSIWSRPLNGDGWSAIHSGFLDKVPRAYTVPVPSKFIGTSNRWVEIGNEKCLVLAKDAEPLLTPQAFYFMIMDHDVIWPLVSERFWTFLSQSPASFDVGLDDDSDGADDDTPLMMLYQMWRWRPSILQI